MTEARNLERHAMIELAAYYRAEKRGFEPGHDLEDWLEAEAEIVAHTLSRTLPVIAGALVTGE